MRSPGADNQCLKNCLERNVPMTGQRNGSAPEKEEELGLKPMAPSTSQPPEIVVSVRNACKKYGYSKYAEVVLEGLNMTLNKGTIYALLGASGCGKTTLLSCILGQRTLNSGHIWVLGGRPDSKSSGVPGPRVGYMPQNIALYVDFTIRETFLYYGWVLGMTTAEIHARGCYLQSLLKLPDVNQLVKNLSGGQQRRVSLATTLLHQPELLILDEPTVGVDPLIREAIWKHLLELVGKGTTILLTTHYIEEARQAHVVGLMRGGCLLAEQPPEKIIEYYKCQTLEEVFLKLSLEQNEYSKKEKDVAVSFHGSAVMIRDYKDAKQDEEAKEIEPFLPTMPVACEDHIQLRDCLPVLNRSRLKALIWKGFMWMWRNIPAMICVVLLPVSQLITFCFAIGHDPVDLSIALVNHETNNSLTCNRTVFCNSRELSCCYIGYLESRSLNMIYFNSEEAAVQSVLEGKTYASIIMKHNYSDALRLRIKKGETTKPWDMTASEIDVFRDVSSKHVATQLKVYLYDAFLNFAQDYVVSCGHKRRTLKVPLKWEKPIYGVKYPNFTEYALPGILIILTFFLAVASTSFGLLIERNEGSFERSFVIGITELELLIAHIVCQFVIMASQCILSLACAFGAFQMTMKGSLWLLALQTFMTGFAGMSYGLFISCICDSEIMAMYLALGSVMPLLFLSGLIWPVEAIHPLLRPVADLAPLTKNIEGTRSLLQRGSDLTAEPVYLGLITISLWAVVFMVVGVAFLKAKKKGFGLDKIMVVVEKNKCCK